MFINDHLVFIQLQKTGSTQIADLINRYWPGEITKRRPEGKHLPLTQPIGDRVILGSVRNPFSWYVSLWAYGCAGKGYLAWILTSDSKRIVLSQIKQAARGKSSPADLFEAFIQHSKKDVSYWRRLYSNPEDVDHFREWLRAIHELDGRKVMPEGFGKGAFGDVAGFYTWRFMSLFTDHTTWRANGHKLADHEQIRDFQERYCIVDYFIRTEHMRGDIERAMETIYGAPVKFELAGPRALNRSSHRRVEEYFDALCHDLVMDKDRLIFESFYH